MQLRVLIVGGGIAGLGFLRALALHGIHADLVERAQRWDPGGTGIFIPANGLKLLDRLGIGDAVRRHASLIEHQQFLDQRGRLMMSIALDQIWGPDAACVAIHRRRLHALLLESTTGAKIRLGTTVARFEQGEGISVAFTDGTKGTYDLVVGADGIRSGIRATSFGTAPRSVGQVSWRFVLERGPAIPAWTVLLGRGRTFLMIPIGDDGLYCYADVNSLSAEDPTQGSLARFIELFGGFADPVPEILGALTPDSARYFAPIEEVVQPSWTNGRIVLIGDAAHATSPNMAEGASLALEDGWVLAEILASRAPLADCLRLFEARRIPRVSSVQRQTHRRDRMRNLPPSLRAGVLRLFGKRIFRANYRVLREAP